MPHRTGFRYVSSLGVHLGDDLSWETLSEINPSILSKGFNCVKPTNWEGNIGLWVVVTSKILSKTLAARVSLSKQRQPAARVDRTVFNCRANIRGAEDRLGPRIQHFRLPFQKVAFYTSN